MPTCELGYEHEEPEPVVVEDNAPLADAAESAAGADVEVARINADRDVEVEKIRAKVDTGWQETRVAELEGQVTGMREILDRLTAPPAEPEPVVVETPAEPAEPETPPPPEQEAKPAPAAKKGGGWFG